MRSACANQASGSATTGAAALTAARPPARRSNAPVPASPRYSTHMSTPATTAPRQHIAHDAHGEHKSAFAHSIQHPGGRETAEGRQCAGQRGDGHVPHPVGTQREREFGTQPLQQARQHGSCTTPLASKQCFKHGRNHLREQRGTRFTHNDHRERAGDVVEAIEQIRSARHDVEHTADRRIDEPDRPEHNARGDGDNCGYGDVGHRPAETMARRHD